MIGVGPDQVPVLTASVCPWVVVPDRVGSAELIGALLDDTMAVTALDAFPMPATLLALTTTCTVEPASADASR